MFPALFFVLLLVFCLLLPLFPLLLLLATLLLFLTAAILLHGMSVQLEQFPCVKFGKIRDKEPEGAFPFFSLILRHLQDEAVNVFANLDQAPPRVNDLEE